MAKKRSSSRSTKTRTVYRTAPRKRRTKKSNSSYIPSAAATVGIAAANKDVIMGFVNDLSVNGAKNALQQAIQPAQLKKTAIYTVGGMLAGEAVKRFAPNVIKAPIGKVAKKIPRVI